MGCHLRTFLHHLIGEPAEHRAIIVAAMRRAADICR
jgi:hypothetical protein